MPKHNLGGHRKADLPGENHRHRLLYRRLKCHTLSSL